MDIDGGDIPSKRIYGIILVYIDEQRTISKAAMWAFYVAMVRHSGPACICSDNFRVVQALRCESSA